MRARTIATVALLPLACTERDSSSLQSQPATLVDFPEYLVAGLQRPADCQPYVPASVMTLYGMADEAALPRGVPVTKASTAANVRFAVCLDDQGNPSLSELAVILPGMTTAANIMADDVLRQDGIAELSFGDPSLLHVEAALPDGTRLLVKGAGASVVAGRAENGEWSAEGVVAGGLSYGDVLHACWREDDPFLDISFDVAFAVDGASFRMHLCDTTQPVISKGLTWSLRGVEITDPAAGISGLILKGDEFKQRVETVHGTMHHEDCRATRIRLDGAAYDIVENGLTFDGVSCGQHWPAELPMPVEGTAKAVLKRGAGAAKTLTLPFVNYGDLRNRR